MAFPGQLGKHWLPFWNRKAKAISKLKSDYAEHPAFGQNFHEAKHKTLPCTFLPMAKEGYILNNLIFNLWY